MAFLADEKNLVFLLQNALGDLHAVRMTPKPILNRELFFFSFYASFYAFKQNETRILISFFFIKIKINQLHTFYTFKIDIACELLSTYWEFMLWAHTIVNGLYVWKIHIYIFLYPKALRSLTNSVSSFENRYRIADDTPHQLVLD